MLTTDERLNIEDYVFNNSPESCSGTSYSTDYTEIASDEDFLQQLSSDLDIPLLLNPGEDEMSLLNSFFDKSPSEIMSEISIPFSDSDQFDDIAEEFSELQKLNALKFMPDAFPNMQSTHHHIKSEPMDSSSDSQKSISPAQSPLFELKDEMKSEPPSPCSSSLSPNHGGGFDGHNGIIISTVPNDAVQLSPQNSIRVAKMPVKRVPSIQPKAPYAISASNKNKMVLLKNNAVVNNGNLSTRPKVVVLENVTAVPVKNVAQLTTNAIQSSSMISNNNNVSPVYVSNSNLTLNVGNIDPKVLKRQQRKIKNRESACLSRKKKKDYLTSLEMQVKDLTTENQKLKLHNQQLQERLAKYEGRCGSANNNFNANNVKNSIVLCIFIFSLGFHLDYIRNPFAIKNQVELRPTDKLKVLDDHHGRNLLWASDETTETKNNTSSNFLPFSMCPAAINQTESARLVLELERWIGKPFDFNEKIHAPNVTKDRFSSKTKLRRRKLNKKYDHSLISSVYSLSNKKSVGGPAAPSDNSNEIQVFSPSPEKLYNEFFEAINRQDDTFYVVSFSDHHMLLPALHHNKTRRPKMSLIMPSMLPNGNLSKPLTYVPLMQIDCEVLDTRLIQIRSGSIPQHLRTPGTNTTNNYDNEAPANGDVSKPSETTANYTRKKAYKPYFIKQNSVKTKDQSDLSL